MSFSFHCDGLILEDILDKKNLKREGRGSSFN